MDDFLIFHELNEAVCLWCRRHRPRLAAIRSETICESCADVCCTILKAAPLRRIDAVVRKDAKDGPGDDIRVVIDYRSPAPPARNDVIEVRTAVEKDGPEGVWSCLVVGVEWNRAGTPTLRLLPLEERKSETPS